MFETDIHETGNIIHGQNTAYILYKYFINSILLTTDLFLTDIKHMYIYLVKSNNLQMKQIQTPTILYLLHIFLLGSTKKL